MNKYEIIEDDGGTITMFVWDENEKCVFGAVVLPEDVKNCIEDVEDASAWDEDISLLESIQEEKGLDSIEAARQAFYENITSYEYGWNTIADNDGVYSEHMGGAGKDDFGIED